jgi:hypothetical protein
MSDFRDLSGTEGNREATGAIDSLSGDIPHVDPFQSRQGSSVPFVHTQNKGYSIAEIKQKADKWQKNLDAGFRNVNF